MLVATTVIVASLGPAIDSLQGARLAASAHESETDYHYRVAGRIEDVLAESFDSLLEAASNAGNALNPSSYSDPALTQDRIVVYLSLYDVANTDGDNDYFTIDDANTDFDNNPFTGTDTQIDVLWLRVEITGTTHVLESLSYRL